MSDLDKVWEALEPHIVWAEHLALILLFATHPRGVDELRGRVEGVLAAEGRSLRVLIPRDLGELGMVTGELVARPETGVGAVWVELWRGSGDAEWDRGVADQLGRMNEVRSLIERKLGRPLVLVLPTALRTSLYVMAPDLWTIRSFTAVVPSPAAVTRGLVERVGPREPEIFTVGPPSAAEREWARIMANVGPGEFQRIDPWDGFRAVDGAMRRGSLLSARAIALEALDVAEMLAKAEPDSALVQRDLSVSLIKLGDVEKAAGDLAAARGLYQRSMDLRERLAKADPDSALVQRDLSVSLIKLGALEMKAGDLSVARGLHQRSLEVSEGLAKAKPDSLEAQRDLSVSLIGLGDVEMEAGNLSVARSLYQRSLDLSEELAKAEPDSLEAQRDLSAFLNRLGNVEMEEGNLAEARSFYQRSIEMSEGLVKADPHNVQAQRDFSAPLTNLGSVEMEAGNPSVARSLYQRSLEVNEELAKADPHDAQASFDVVRLHLCLVTLAGREHATETVKHHLQAASERMRELDGHVTGYRERETARDRIQQLERELGS